MKCALAGVGFINEDIEYNKAVLADTLRKCAGRADVVIFEEAFLQGFYGINFIAKHDTTVSIPLTVNSNSRPRSIKYIKAAKDFLTSNS